MKPVMEYNPILADDLLEGDTDEGFEVRLYERCKYLRIIPLTGTTWIYINSLSNTPPLRLYESVKLENKDGRILSILVRFKVDSSSVNIKQVHYPAGMPRDLFY